MSLCQRHISKLYNYEAETHEPSEHLREHLNQYYDEFVSKYGNLNEKQNVRFILMDANGRDALALERGENERFVKADIFDHPVSFAVDEPDKRRYSYGGIVGIAQQIRCCES